MKQVRLIIIICVVFFGTFYFFYKHSRKFRFSIIATILTIMVYLTSLSPALGDGFQPQKPETSQLHSSDKTVPRLFGSKGRASNSGSAGSGNNGESYSNDFSNESIEKLKQRLDRIKQNKNRLQEDSESDEQCLQVDKSFESNKELKKLTNRALRSPAIQRELDNIVKKLSDGTRPNELSSRVSYLEKGLTYVRKEKGHFIVKEDKNGKKPLDIVAIANRDHVKDMKYLAKKMNEMYDVNIDPNSY